MSRDEQRNSVLIMYHYRDLGSVAASIRNFWVCSSDVKLWGNHCSIRCWPFSQAIFLLDLHLNNTAKLPVWLSPRVLESIFGQHAFTKECLPPKNWRASSSSTTFATIKDDKSSLVSLVFGVLESSGDCKWLKLVQKIWCENITFTVIAHICLNIVIKNNSQPLKQNNSF